MPHDGLDPIAASSSSFAARLWMKVRRTDNQTIGHSTIVSADTSVASARGLSSLEAMTNEDSLRWRPVVASDLAIGDSLLVDFMLYVVESRQETEAFGVPLLQFSLIPGESAQWIGAHPKRLTARATQEIGQAVPTAEEGEALLKLLAEESDLANHDNWFRRNQVIDARFKARNQELAPFVRAMAFAIPHDNFGPRTVEVWRMLMAAYVSAALSLPRDEAFHRVAEALGQAAR